MVGREEQIRICPLFDEPVPVCEHAAPDGEEP